MIKTSVFCVITIILFASCSSNPSTSPPDATLAFTTRTVEMSANSDSAVSDRPVTFTIRCHPQVTGVGRMYLDGHGSYAESLLFIESPRADTLDTAKWRFEYPVAFTAGVPAELKVIVRMQPNMTYFYGSGAFLDSVFIPDSNRMFHVNSDVARAYSGRSGGYIDDAYYGPTFPLYWKY